MHSSILCRQNATALRRGAVSWQHLARATAVPCSSAMQNRPVLLSDITRARKHPPTGWDAAPAAPPPPVPAKGERAAAPRVLVSASDLAALLLDDSVDPELGGNLPPWANHTPRTSSATAAAGAPQPWRSPAFVASKGSRGGGPGGVREATAALSDTAASDAGAPTRVPVSTAGTRRRSPERARGAPAQHVRGETRFEEEARFLARLDAVTHGMEATDGVNATIDARLAAVGAAAAQRSVETYRQWRVRLPASLLIWRAPTRLLPPLPGASV